MKPGSTRIYSPFSPSLDRISPGCGYTQENVRLVCTAMNIALNQFGEDVFRRLAESYLQHNPLERIQP